MSNAYHRLDSLEDSFLYFLDCQLATVEELQGLRRPPQRRLDRHRQLARKMIERARVHGIDLSGESRVSAFEKENP